ncbi:hypothetical protein GMSM_41750 [Geomonas sp. Red276]
MDGVESKRNGYRIEDGREQGNKDGKKRVEDEDRRVGRKFRASRGWNGSGSSDGRLRRWRTRRG